MTETMKHFFTLITLVVSPLAICAQLWSDDFESYNDGYQLTDAPWDSWSGFLPGSVSSEESHLGTKSLKLEEFTTTPTHSIVLAGLQGGSYYFDFWIYVSEGHAARYNFTDSYYSSSAVDFETFINGDGTVTMVGGGLTYINTFDSDAWVFIQHEIHLDEGFMSVRVDGEFYSEFAYASDFVGGLNFFGNNFNALPSKFFVDDIVVGVGSSPGLFGCTDPTACNYDPNAIDDDGSCLQEDECGICGGSGIGQGDCDCSGNTLDALGICGGNCLSDYNSNWVCDSAEVFGCMYHWAINFNPEATSDDGSCESPCVGAINQNVFDWDGDSSVTITDFLAMLAVFGDVDVDSDGVWDSSDECTDLAACNYADEPSTPCQFLDVLGVCGGGCEADEDNDGVCDDIDDCIGVVDECGVCNGPGPTEVVIDDITIIYDSVYAENIDTWFVYELGADTTFSITCAPSFSTCGDPVSYQGYDYATVLIGEQCWFAENLRSENYENGDAIPAGLSNEAWETTSTGAVAVYGEGNSSCNNESTDGDGCDEAWSLNEYGRLYNWYAVDDARQLCPSGWHVPTDMEWLTMEMALGMSEGEANSEGYWRGTNEGSQMKTIYGWKNGGNGTNSSGFAGMPGGNRQVTDGSFYNNGSWGTWWSSSPLGSNAWYRTLSFERPEVFRYVYTKNTGFSVRCIQDSEE